MVILRVLGLGLGVRDRGGDHRYITYRNVPRGYVSMW